MSTPEALRLADEISRVTADPGVHSRYCGFILSAAAELRRQHAEIERLTADNFVLAAGQCVNVTGDDGGTPRCAEIARLKIALDEARVRARLVNIAYERLTDDKSFLSRAYRQVCADAAHRANEIEHLTAERDAVRALLSDELFAGSKDWAHGDLAQRVNCLLTWLDAAKTEARVAYLAFEQVTAERDALANELREAKCSAKN